MTENGAAIWHGGRDHSVWAPERVSSEAADRALRGALRGGRSAGKLCGDGSTLSLRLHQVYDLLRLR